MIAAQDLRQWPMFLRKYVHWFLPSCMTIRAELAKSFRIVNPVLEKRRLAKATRKEQGLEPEEYLDAMEWMDQSAAGRPYDPTISQIMMAIAANFSGSDSLTTVLVFLCEQPELVADMRKEIIAVMKENKWNKSSIYKLRLMDSVLKESQRMKPAAVGKSTPFVPYICSTDHGRECSRHAPNGHKRHQTSRWHRSQKRHQAHGLNSQVLGRVHLPQPAKV